MNSSARLMVLFAFWALSFSNPAYSEDTTNDTAIKFKNMADCVSGLKSPESCNLNPISKNLALSEITQRCSSLAGMLQNDQMQHGTPEMQEAQLYRDMSSKFSSWNGFATRGEPPVKSYTIYSQQYTMLYESVLDYRRKGKTHPLAFIFDSDREDCMAHYKILPSVQDIEAGNFVSEW